MPRYPASLLAEVTRRHKTACQSAAAWEAFVLALEPGPETDINIRLCVTGPDFFAIRPIPRFSQDVGAIVREALAAECLVELDWRSFALGGYWARVEASVRGIDYKGEGRDERAAMALCRALLMMYHPDD